MHEGTDGQPLEGGECATLREQVDHVTDSLGGEGLRLVILKADELLHRGSVDLGVQDSVDVIGLRVPDFTTGRVCERVVRAGEEVVLLAVHKCRSIHASRRIVEEVNDLEEVVHEDVLVLLVGGRQILARGVLERSLVCRILQPVLTQEDALSVGHLREAPTLSGAIRVDLVGVGDQRRVGLNVELGVQREDIVCLHNPPWLGERTQPLAVDDHQVELVRSRSERRCDLLEELTEGCFGERQIAYVVAVRLLGVGLERRPHSLGR